MSPAHEAVKDVDVEAEEHRRTQAAAAVKETLNRIEAKREERRCQVIFARYASTDLLGSCLKC
jgi:hypothetical protein